MNIEKQKRFIINFFYFVILFGLSILIVRFALPALFPFAIALLVTLLLRPLVRLCVEKLHFNRKAASALFVVLFYGTIGLLVVLLVIKLIGYIGILIARLPEFFNQTVTPALNAATSKLSELIENFDAHGMVDIDETAAKVISSLSTAISDFSGKALAFVGSYATSVPSLLLNIVITIISTAFMLMDYDSIKAFIVRQLPDEKRRFIASVAEHLGKVIWKYLTSYLIIMLITFAKDRRRHGRYAPAAHTFCNAFRQLCLRRTGNIPCPHNDSALSEPPGAGHYTSLQDCAGRRESG
mgnify:CR=1 FL=1